jgi:hypothetical protein
VSLRFFYRPSWRPLAEDPAVEFTESVPLYTLDVTEQAEEGSVGTSQLIVSDPLGALDFPPLTRIWATENEISASSNTHVFDGYIADRNIHRGASELTGSARIWEVSVVDENSILTRRVLSSASANRPAETDVARVTWLANEADGQLLIDSVEFLFGAGPVNMDAADYRGQTGQDVLADCAEQSGKNYWAYQKEGVGTGIWYGSMDHTAHQSMVRLSNVLTDIDNNTTFAIGDGDATVLWRDPSRLLSGIYGQFANGATYVRNQSMFARIGMRDAPMSWPNVKTTTTAEARANRMLADLDTEMDRITTTCYLPAAKVNWIKAGMRLQFRASHLPGYEDFVWLRVLKCSTAQVSEQFYLKTLELSSNDIPAQPIPNTFPASGILYQPANGGGGGIHPAVRFGSSGDAPAAGYPTVPLQGSLEYVTDTLYGGGLYTFKGFRALGSGTLTVTFRASDIAGVVGTVTCTPAILLNGAIVASSPHTTTDAAAPGFPYGHSNSWDFSTDVSVVNGDVVSAQMSSTWGSSMTVPSGAGGNAESLAVSGSLT